MKLQDLFEEETTLPTFKLVTFANTYNVGTTFPITYSELRAVFGKHNFTGSPGDKTSTEWTMRFSDGTPAAIYDYKQTSYYDRGLQTPTQFRRSEECWNVGGNGEKSLLYVLATIFKHWSDDKVNRTLLKIFKEPNEFMNALRPGYHEKTMATLIRAAKLAGADITAVEAAINKSFGK